MDTLVAYIVGACFLLMFIFRILYALLYPDKFAEGARKVLFIDARKKALFPPQEKKRPPSKTTTTSDSRET